MWFQKRWMHYQDPFRIRYRLRLDEIYQKREMHVPSMERGAYLLRQETVLEIDAAMILVSGRLGNTLGFPGDSAAAATPAAAGARAPVARPGTP